MTAASEQRIRTRTIRPPSGLALDLPELWAERELLWQFCLRNLRIRYKQSLAGPGWAVFQPLFTMIVFTVFFGHVAKLSSGGTPYPVFFYSALVAWTYFATALAAGAGSLVDNQALLSKVYFPRVFLPLSFSLSGLVDLAIATSLGIPLALAYGVSPGVTLLFIPLGALIAALACSGFSAFLATLNAKYRDVRMIVPFFVQAGLFVSPVAFSVTLVPRAYRDLYAINPMTSAIELFRYAFTGSTALTSAMVLISSFVAIVGCVSGLIYARRRESTLADVV